MVKGLKVWLPVLVVFAVLAGSYLVTNWVRGQADATGDSDAAAQATAARDEATALRSATAQRTGTARATSTPKSSTAAVPARDLAEDEERGGHTLARHVGRSDEQLRSRLKAEPDISAASTFTDQRVAEETVGTALTKNAKKLSDWEAQPGTRPNLVLRVTMKETIGRSIRQGTTRAVTASAAVVVLKWTGGSWYVLTSYPEEKR